jgi:hypothetical protein
VNGVHDMGGQHGHGPVDAERDEPVFHERWEGRVYALMRLARRCEIFNLDEMRRAIEAIAPADYLADSYYERWLAALEALLAEKGVTGAGPMRFTGKNPRATAAGAHRFARGDRVRTRNFNPQHHTRLPRYARDREGVVESVRAAFVLPDANAHIAGPDDDRPFEHVYTVVFEGRELWGEDGGASDRVTVDLHESYLEPADGGAR